MLKPWDFVLDHARKMDRCTDRIVWRPVAPQLTTRSSVMRHLQVHSGSQRAESHIRCVPQTTSSEDSWAHWTGAATLLQSTWPCPQTARVGRFMC